MKLSHYLKTFPCKDDPNSLIVFSTQRISKIRVSKETFDRMEQGDLSPSEVKLLTELGMIVPDTEKEKAEVYRTFDLANAKNSFLNAIVVLNMDCNFSCLYCYEGGPGGNQYMTHLTANRLVSFIRSKITPEKKNLIIDFYGGEPLLNIGAIEHIAGDLGPFMKARGGKFFFTLITNGSLFKRSVAEKLAAIGLSSVRITLDGPAETHNRYRPFKSGAGSFDILIQNIKDTADLVDIHIGGNYDETSWRQFPLLLDFLEHNGLTPDILKIVKFDPIIRPTNQKHLLSKYHGGCASGIEPWILEAENTLRREILRRGYFTPKIRPIMCAIENNSTYVVNWDGKLYKCPGFNGDERYAIGNVDSEEIDFSRTYRLDIWKNEDCLDCEYLPLCFGGCRYLSFLKDNTIKTVDCRREYFDAALENLVNQDIEFPNR